MKRKLELLILVLLAAMFTGWAPVMAFTSPIVSPLPTQTMPVLVVVTAWSEPAGTPGVAPVPATPTPTVIPEPTPSATPSTWSDAGLWMGTYRLLVNERGDYCIPELAGCG